jgi:hypothetical protein
MTVSVPYSDNLNPYSDKQASTAHMRRAFRIGYEWAAEGKKPADCEYLQRDATKRPSKSAWWRGYYTQRGEYDG